MSDDNQDDEDFSIDPNEVIEVIDLPENASVDDNDFDSEGENDNEDEMDTAEALAAPVRDDSVLTFTGHKDSSVICTRLSPAGGHLVVTGGQDDKAWVWNTQNGTVLFECTGHTDTVASVGFSHDGTMVASADMKGLIKVWRVDTGKEVWSFEVSEIEWTQWHQAAPVLLAGTKDGQVWMWKLPQGDCKTMIGHGPGSTCGKFLPDGKHAYVGYEDGVIKIWDLKSAEPIHTVSGHEGHRSSVLCVDHNTGGSLIISGSDDMTAKVINTATGKVVSTLACHGVGEDEDSVEAVGFSATHDYAATGTLSGSLEIWDLPSKSVRQRCDHPYGVVKLLWSRTAPVLYTACLDGSIRKFDSRSGQLVGTWHGHKAAVLDFDMDRDEKFIVTGSDDATAKVFALQSGPR